MNKKDDATTKKKKRVRRDRTEEILEETTKLFGEYGFKGTTLAMVAEAVGLTEAGVLHYFPSKIHLLQGVLAYRDQKDFEKYSVLLETDRKDSAELFNLLEGVYLENEKYPELIQLFIVLVGESIRLEHPSHDFFVDRYRRGREIYAQQLSSLSQVKVRADVDYKDLASVIMATLDGLQIQWLLDPENVDLTVAFRLFSQVIISYLEE